MDTISLPFPNVQFQNVNYFLTPLRVGHIREKNGHIFVFFLMKGKLHHCFMSCFIHSFHRVSLWTNFLPVSMWVPKKSLLPPCPKKYRSFSFLFHSQNLKIHATCGGQHYLEGKNWHFLYCISKRIGAIFLSFFAAKLLNDYF
jgi:hypothetical protein